MDAEQCIGVEDEYQDVFTRCENVPFKRRVTGVVENVSTAVTPGSGTSVPGLDVGFEILWTRSLFPDLLATPLDPVIKRFGPQDY